MDKYDVLFILDIVKNKIKDIRLDRKEVYKKYLLSKLDWMRRFYYVVRIKKSAEYNKKHSSAFKPGIHEAMTLNRKHRYAWDLFSQIEEKKNG